MIKFVTYSSETPLSSRMRFRKVSRSEC